MIIRLAASNLSYSYYLCFRNFIIDMVIMVMAFENFIIDMVIMVMAFENFTVYTVIVIGMVISNLSYSYYSCYWNSIIDMAIEIVIN